METYFFKGLHSLCWYIFNLFCTLKTAVKDEFVPLNSYIVKGKFMYLMVDSIYECERPYKSISRTSVAWSKQLYHPIKYSDA